VAVAVTGYPSALERIPVVRAERFLVASRDKHACHTARHSPLSRTSPQASLLAWLTCVKNWFWCASYALGSSHSATWERGAFLRSAPCRGAVWRRF